MSQNEDIIIQIKNGNVEAFNKLFMETYYQLYFHCRKYISDPEEAKDLLQNVYLRFWERRQEIDIRTSIYAYLCRSVQNECLNYLRSNREFNRLSDSELEKSTNDLLTEKEYNSPDSEFEFLELEKIIYKAIESLPEQCKLIFHLSRDKGLKNQEIANELNLSVRTVDTQIYRALKVIKSILHEYMAILIGLFLLNK